MHDAWLINDIWLLIADHLDPKDFGVLAQTCKALFPLASAERWKTLTSFSGFLACLPRRHQNIALRVEDLERMDFYSALVQKIVLGYKGGNSNPLRIPAQYDAGLEKLKTQTKGTEAERAERKKKQEERARIKAEKKRDRRRKRGLPELDGVSKEQGTGSETREMDLAELKVSLTDQDGERQEVEKKMWADLWAEIARLRPQSTFLPNLQKLIVYNGACDYLLPLTGISGSYMEVIDLRVLHGQSSAPEKVNNFLYQLQDVSRLEYLFVRDGIDLIPQQVFARAPLTHLRLDPRVTSGGWFDENSFKEGSLPVEIFNKATLKKLTIGLSRDW